MNLWLMLALSLIGALFTVVFLLVAVKGTFPPPLQRVRMRPEIAVLLLVLAHTLMLEAGPADLVGKLVRSMFGS